MRRWTWMLGIVLVGGAVTAMAQPPAGPGGGEGRGPRGAAPGGPGGQRGEFRPLPNPLFAALDTDSDGEISAKEIESAAKSLATLDKNKDGKLTDDETRPPRPEGRGDRFEGRGPGGPPENAGRRPGGEGADRPEGRGPEGRGPEGRGPEGRGPTPAPNPERFVEHALEFDADKDGKLDKAELMKFAEDMARRRFGPGGPGGPGAGRGGPDGPGDRPRDGERPDRPRRPE